MDLDVSEAPLAMPAAAADPAAPPGDGQATEPPKTEPPKTGDKPDDSERVIELARQNREHERARKDAETQATEARQQVQKLEPVLELLKLAETDPLAAIEEMADVMGLSAERVLEALQTRGAGGEIALTAEDKIARLERQLEELRGGKPAEKKPEAKDQAGEQARQGILNTFGAILESSPEKYPAAAKDPDAPHAAFLVQVRHWESHKGDPGYRPLGYAQALAAVERVLAGKAPSQGAAGGLSNCTPAAVVPDADRVLSDEEIRQDLLRRMNAR